MGETVERIMRARWLLGLVGIGLAGCDAAPKPRIEREPVRSASAATRVTRDFAVPVLMYHRVAPLSESEARNPLTRDLTVLPEDFESQVRFLKEEGYQLLSVYDVQQALLSGDPLPEKAAAITLDDGYRDNFEHAFPILRKYGASATIFLVQKTVGDARHLDWGEIRQMRGQGVRYGSHSATHADLTALDEAGLRTELLGSRRFFEAGLEEPVTSLAYPAGKFDDRVAACARGFGYLTAWKKGGGPVRPGDDPFRLPRIRVHGQTDLADFRRKASSGIWAMRQEREARRDSG